MKAKFGAIVVDGRGKIGGHVASKNKAGSYFRTKTTPTNPNTSSQLNVRSSFSSLSQGWRGLTQAQRDSWNSGAPNFPYTDIFGDTKILSGFGLYMQLNGNLANVGAPLLTNCPTPTSVLSLGTFVVQNDAGDLTIDQTPATVPAGYSQVILATQGLSAGRAFSKSYARQIHYYAPAAAVASITNFYTEKFGTVPSLSENTYISAFLVNLSSGQVSQMITTLVVSS